MNVSNPSRLFSDHFVFLFLIAGTEVQKADSQGMGIGFLVALQPFSPIALS
jgi:hypothetical protein